MKPSSSPGIRLDRVVSLLRDLVHEQTGLYFDDGRCDLLLDKLSPLMVEPAPDSLLNYYYLLKYDSGARDEWRKIFDVLTVQESFFWREMEQVRALVDEIVPQHFSRNPDDTLNIWSAACAGGEEPLTIAMALHEAGWFDRARIDIHGSDASPRAIQGAQSGIYAERSFRSLPPELREKYFVDDEGGVRISCDLRARVRWQITNLMSEADLLWAPTGSQIIFCRNMFIYFSESAVRKTVRVFAERMKRPGYLFLGAAESLMQMPVDFEPKEIGAAFVYVEELAVTQLLRVLVVDDSAFVRKTIRQMLSRSPFIEVVGIAGNGEEALEKVRELAPDVVTLDLMMPELDGLGFLRAQMAIRPLPVVVVSTASGDQDLVLKALEAGAVDFVHKPSMLATETLFEMSEELIEKVKAAATIRLRKFDPISAAQAPGGAPRWLGASGSVGVVVIGISTGGPQGLKYLIPQLPETFSAPIAIVLHIPVGYTELYAATLDEISKLKVSEAKEGDCLRAGVVLIAPAGRHLTFRRDHDGSVVSHLDLHPTGTLHRPSVDVLFESASEIFGDRTLGIVMTGMGSDGRRGASCIKTRGGRIYTEAEESCVVYGMPATVVEAGLSDRSVPLDRLAEAILEVV